MTRRREIGGLSQVLVLDTSAFINGWNVHYAGPVFTPVWEAIDRLLASGVAIMPREVFLETQAKRTKVSRNGC